jgi:UDP-N-acetylglucosamine transferase subunit ALG13
MIFVTVGTQLPFDRLVQAVDEWAGRHPDEEVIAQVGPAKVWPRNMEHELFLPPARADALMKRANLIVAHAGMGSVLNALALQRPIIIVPRRAALGEHRNDHQVATARWLEGRPGVFVAWDEAAIFGMLDDHHHLASGEPISPYASGPLVELLATTVTQSLQGR